MRRSQKCSFPKTRTIITIADTTSPLKLRSSSTSQPSPDVAAPSHGVMALLTREDPWNT